MTIHREKNSGQNACRSIFDLAWEERVYETAYDALNDIQECDGLKIYISWQTGPLGKTVPMLYLIFPGTSQFEKMPRVYIENTKIKGCHAILLVSLPSHAPIEGLRLKDFIRRETEIFLRKYNVSIHTYTEKTKCPTMGQA